MTLFAFLLSVVTAASAQAPAAGLTRIGAAAAVKGAVKAQAPGQAVGRVLGSGKPVFLNDHVTTDAAGRLQVLLLDETVFTIGPNSDMMLDEFVYDPATSAGKVTAQVTKGVFRFVTGKVARKDPGSMKVKLPVGTIGIRGTIAGGQASPGGSTVILFGPGAPNNANENPGSVAVGNAGSEVVITQPGFGTTVSPGQAPSAVTDMSQQAAQISNMLGEPAPQGGAPSGGAGGPSPTQQAGQDTAAGGVSADIAGAVGDFTGGLDNTQTVASQQGTASSIADGISTWDSVRSLTGSAFYTGTGNYTCSGTLACGGGYTGTGLSFGLTVDFGARQVIGGLGSSDVAIFAGPLSGSQTALNSFSFAGLSGDAVILLSGANHTNSNFNNTTITLMNSGGIAAKDAVVVLSFNNTSDIASGTATGSR
ncbi:MAG: FecR domain-containing protein [Elusimicrobia bacterium]|nr:FecR domain-containing protein [Elusimicrobiota bacterium]